ncbi:MAG: M4 family metallopeptidase, partial [Mangrovimonas sp.]|nr:M4 family metallopeptidase [Mangrovimonas sp.]
MKNTSKLLVIGLLCSIFASSQNLQDAQITYGKVTGTPEFIRFPKDNPLSLQGTSLQQKALNFLQDNAQLFGISSVGDSFRFTTESEDAQGFTHVEFTQVFNAIPVFDGKLKFHFDTNHKLSAVNGNFIPNIKLNPQPVLSGSEANAIALAEVERQGLNISGAPLFVNSNKLYVFQKGLVENRDKGQYLVYEVEVRNNNDVREFMYINAYNGSLVEQYTGMAHAINRIVYEVDTSNIVWQEGDAFPGTLSIWQQNEVVVSEHVYNFFNNTFGFLSYDNADATMRTINNNPNISCPNANWNGFSVNYCDGTAADDVIAHEWGHAYTQYTSGLIYSYQAGAINEAYSDIWGETVDLINGYQDTGENLALRTGCGSSLRWRMGEDASAFGSPIRDMWNPPCNGDPGKVTDGIYYCGNGDSGGVHINSGIPNHAYALLVDGGTYNGQTITGIGLTKAAHIFWRAQSVYLTSTSDFGSLADALEAACTDLIGQNLEGLSTAVFAAGPSGEIITTSDFDELVKVLLAVELKLDPDTCGFEPILSAT